MQIDKEDDLINGFNSEENHINDHFEEKEDNKAKNIFYDKENSVDLESSSHDEIINSENNHLMDLNPDEYQWYVVSVIKNSETAIYKSFVEFAKSSTGDIIEVYIPEETVKKYKDNKEIIQRQPIMNYLYVKCRIGFIQNKEFKIKINKKYQVIGTISEEELLKSKIENEKLESSRSLEFHPGMKVKVITGNYAGFSGQINSVHDESVVLTILILNFPTMIEVYKRDLVPAEED